MRSLAYSCATIASFRHWSSCAILASTIGSSECLNISGNAFGAFPYMSSNGVWVLSAWGQLLYTNLAFFKAWFQVEGWLMQKIEKYNWTSLLTLSVPPFACGWKAVVMDGLMSRSWQSSRKNSASNCTPRSVMILSGSPKREKICLMKSSAIRWAVRPCLVQGMSTIPCYHFVISAYITFLIWTISIYGSSISSSATV